MSEDYIKKDRTCSRIDVATKFTNSPPNPTSQHSCLLKSSGVTPISNRGHSN